MIELRAALAAAAAHYDAKDWAQAFGEWAGEIARAAPAGKPARQVLDDLDELCLIEPALGAGAGRAMALLLLRLAS